MGQEQEIGWDMGLGRWLSVWSTCFACRKPPGSACSQSIIRSEILRTNVKSSSSLPQHSQMWTPHTQHQKQALWYAFFHFSTSLLLVVFWGQYGYQETKALPTILSFQLSSFFSSFFLLLPVFCFFFFLPHPMVLRDSFLLWKSYAVPGNQIRASCMQSSCLPHWAISGSLLLDHSWLTMTEVSLCGIRGYFIKVSIAGPGR